MCLVALNANTGVNDIDCSILGMYLFGGKFCMYDDGLRECNCEEIVNKHPLCHCDRKHFNNVLWATVTVFQVSSTNLLFF